MTPLEHTYAHIGHPKSCRQALSTPRNATLLSCVIEAPSPRAQWEKPAVAQHHRERFLPTRETTRQQRKSSDYSCVTTSDSQDPAGSKRTAVQRAQAAVPHRCKGFHVEEPWRGLATGYTGSTFPWTYHASSPMLLVVNVVSAMGSWLRGCWPQPWQMGCKLGGEPVAPQADSCCAAGPREPQKPSSNLCA